jgi:uncharacterized protein (TIGR02996 family)
MTDDTSFVEAIRARPWDESLRLVYADWLEERGDARADYLRAESAATAELRFQDRPEGDQARSLLDRLGQLRAGFDPGWLAAVGRPDWILLEKGDPKTIQAATVRHTELTPPEVPTQHQVSLFALGPGRFGLVFWPPLPPYEFCNLVGWLGDPRRNKGVASAAGWLTSRRTGVRYLVTPDPAHIGGDTLLAASMMGQPMRVYLPDCGLRRAAEGRPRVEEPRWAPAEAECLRTFEVEADSNPGFGNLEFVEGPRRR